VATLPAYVAYLVLAVTTIARDAHTSAELTPADIDELGVAWMAVHVLWVLPPVLAAVALVGVARRVPGPLTRAVPLFAGITVTVAAVYLVVNALAFGADDETWGDSALYPWSPLASLFAGWFGVHVATLVVVAALVRAGIAKRTAIVVGALYALYVVFEVLSYLPVIFGPATLAGFLGGVPPFLLGIFWAVLGGGLLKSPITSGV
jgi:hypothetical protein